MPIGTTCGLPAEGAGAFKEVGGLQRREGVGAVRPEGVGVGKAVVAVYAGRDVEGNPDSVCMIRRPQHRPDTVRESAVEAGAEDAVEDDAGKGGLRGLFRRIPLHPPAEPFQPGEVQRCQFRQRLP